MRAVYSLDGAKNLDKKLIEEYSLIESELIDSAAMNAYKAVREYLIDKKVLFLIGPGNNGSDGLEMARLLAKENLNVSLFYLYDKGNDENLKRRARIDYLDRAFEFTRYDVIVDALFGFSFRGEVDEYLSEVINEVNHSGSFVISLDVPSALKIRADITVEFMVDKLLVYHPMLRAQAGRIYLRNPGFPEAEIRKSQEGIYLLEDSDQIKREVSLSDYKNTRGHLAVAGGSDRYPGAPVLSCLAAFHSGAGLVSLMSKESVMDKVFSSYPSIITSKKELPLADYDSILLGPGWDDGDERKLCEAIDSGRPFVVDADGLKLLNGKKLKWRGIITPHIGEYKRICRDLGVEDGMNKSDELIDSIKLVSKKLEAVVVLKSSTVWITDSDQVYIYDGANPSLGVAGSGDVLSGIIAAETLSSHDMLSSAINGVIIHQRAGKRAHERYGYYTAEELIGEIRI